ncbi:MAG: FIST signal transduction protein [Phycisphaeraceae bacterium]
MPADSTLAFAHAASLRDDPADAAEDLVGQLQQRLDLGPDTTPDLVLLFAGADFTLRLGEILGPLRQRLRPRTLVGVTVQGVVAGHHEHESSHAVAALAARLPGVTVQPFSWDQMDWPELVDDDGTALRQRLFAEDTDHVADDCRAVVLFGDPFTCPTVRLLPAFEQALPEVPVVGGMASAGVRPGTNRLVLDGEIKDAGAVGVAIAGPIDVRSTVSQGCRPIGKPAVITRSKRHVVQELAGRPALDVLREVALELDAHDQRLALDAGLFVGRVVDEYKHRFGTGDFLIRGIAGVDPERGYLAVGDPQVRVGQTIQLHVRDAQAARDDLALLLDAERLHGPPAGALLMTCTGRGESFFHDAHVDASLVADALDHPPLAGGFTNGELGPVGPRNHLHAHAVSLLTFRGVTEAADAS